MLSQFSYPIICTDKFADTVAFYEDFFEFQTVLEMDRFAIMKRMNWTDDAYVSVIDSDHKALPETHRKPVQGMILNYPVKDISRVYEALYFEGVKNMGQPQNALCGRKHFFVEDPNGILIDVAENIDISELMSPEEFKTLCAVS